MDRWTVIWNLLVWVLLPGGVVAASASTVSCLRKDIRIWGAVAAATTALAIAVMIGSWSADSSSFGDAAVFLVFVFIELPLIVAIGIAATRRLVSSDAEHGRSV